MTELLKQVKYNVRRDLNNWNTKESTIRYYGLKSRDYTKIQLHGKEAEQRLAHLRALLKKNRAKLSGNADKKAIADYRKKVQSIVGNNNGYMPEKVYRYTLTKRGIERVMNVIRTRREQRKAMNVRGIEGYPKNLAKLYTDANNILNGDLTSYEIEKGTGLNHSTIIRLRHPNGNQGHQGLRHAPLKTLALLAGYPNKDLMKMYRFNRARGKVQLDAYLMTSLAKHNFSVVNMEVVIANVLTFAKNISALSRRTGIDRSKLQRLAGKSGKQFYDPLYLKADDIAQLTNTWRNMGRRPVYDADDIKVLRKRYKK